jgi:hypothetical protein
MLDNPARCSVFEAFVFEPEPSRRDASETDGRAERPIERVRRSQDVEVIAGREPALRREEPRL